MSKEIVKALANASKSVKDAPAAPVFDREARRALIETAFAGLPEKFIDNALREAEAKHNETYGDASDKLARIVLADIAPAFGGIEAFAKVAARMATEARTAGKVTVTGSEWRAALSNDKDAKPEHVTLAESAAKLYKDGKNWSEIAETLNLAPAAQQQLYGVAKEFPATFPKR